MSQSSSNNPENTENGKYRDNDAGESSRQNPVIEEEFIDFEEFKRITDLVLVNRMDKDIKRISNKIYTRDLFSRD